MCGRYTLRVRPETNAEVFDLDEVPLIEPRYNIAPTQPVPAVRLDPQSQQPEFSLFQWELIPSWANDPSIGNKLINAGAETVAEKPAYRHSFKSKRCLVIADAFYEWRKVDGSKVDGREQPYFIHLKDDRPFAFAGLWDYWERAEDAVQSCTLITTGPNNLMAPIHDRMPVIIPKSDYKLWLDPEVKDPKRLQPLLGPYPAEEMEAYPVSTLVNNPAHEDERCIRRVG